MRGHGGSRSLTPALVLVGLLLAGCSGGDDFGIQAVEDTTPTTEDTPTTEESGPTTDDAPTTTRRATTSTVTTVAPSTTAAPVTTAPVTPLRIEDAAVPVWAAWPRDLASPGPTRLRGLVPGSDDAPPHDGESLPATPTVPHGYTLANGGSYSIRATAYEFGDPGAAAAWVAQWVEYGGRGAIERDGGATVLNPSPIPDDGSGWVGLVLDRLEHPDAGTPGTWTRTAHLTAARGPRAFRAEVTWSGAGDAEVPDLVPSVRELAAAQDIYLTTSGVTSERPGVGDADALARIVTTDTMLPWASLLAQPGMDPPRLWDEYTTVSLAAMPDEVAIDRPALYAERYLIGSNDRPLVLAVVEFSSPEAAAAAVGRWDGSSTAFGPFGFADLGVASEVRVTAGVGTPIPEIGATSYGLDFDAADQQDLTLGGGWLQRGTRVYAVVLSYPEGRERNAEVAVGLLVDQAARLDALGLS